MGDGKERAKPKRKKEVNVAPVGSGAVAGHMPQLSGERKSLLWVSTYFYLLGVFWSTTTKPLSRGKERVVQIKEQQQKEGKRPISFFVGSLNRIVRRLVLGLRVPSKDLFELGLGSRVDVVDNDAGND